MIYRHLNLELDILHLEIGSLVSESASLRTLNQIGNRECELVLTSTGSILHSSLEPAIVLWLVALIKLMQLLGCGGIESRTLLSLI